MIKKPSGSSIVDHSIRHKLKLSVEEYILCDLIYQFNKRYKVGALTNAKYFSIIGFMPHDVIRIGTQLRAKGLIITDSLKKRPATTKLWDNNFNDDANFDVLWSIHPRGNKAEAKSNFMQSQRIASFAILCEKLQEYVDYCNKTERQLKDLSGWLNPKKKHWEDVFEQKGGKGAANEDTSNDNSIPSTLFN